MCTQFFRVKISARFQRIFFAEINFFVTLKFQHVFCITFSNFSANVLQSFSASASNVQRLSMHFLQQFSTLKRSDGSSLCDDYTRLSVFLTALTSLSVFQIIFSKGSAHFSTFQRIFIRRFCAKTVKIQRLSAILHAFLIVTTWQFAVLIWPCFECANENLFCGIGKTQTVQAVLTWLDWSRFWSC